MLALREPQGPLSGHCNADLSRQACVSHGVMVACPSPVTGNMGATTWLQP